MAAATLPISGTLSQAWFGCGLATVIIPLGIFFGSQLANTDDNDDNSNQSQTATGSSHGWYFGGYGSDTSQVPIPPGFLIVSYTWSLLVFLGIILHGFKTMQAGTDLSSVVIATVMFANYSILLLFLLGGAQGAVDTYSTCVRGYDFVGQFGVMLYITGLLWFAFSTVFAIIFYRKAKEQHVTKVEVDPSDYDAEYKFHDND